jgi:hypothetical protein
MRGERSAAAIRFINYFKDFIFINLYPANVENRMSS